MFEKKKNSQRNSQKKFGKKIFNLKKLPGHLLVAIEVFWVPI